MSTPRNWAGMPLYMQHDMHRLTGWSRPLGLYATARWSGRLGLIEEPETEQEKAELQARATDTGNNTTARGLTFRDELIARVARQTWAALASYGWRPLSWSDPASRLSFIPICSRPAWAPSTRTAWPTIATFYRRMAQVQPGVFHGRGRNLLLFAHRFFRRSLSHRNKLNDYFLQSFDATARENADLRARLRLDPDLVGHPKSARNLIELEHWRGPLYSDDIATIPNGVAEHKADEQSRLYEGIDRTQVWWKAPESRRADGQAVDYRTFEIEELIENPSGGLGDDQFGCRYAHAEFSADEAAITHFDGSIRAYAWEPYLERIETSIDRAGKRADYTKVFRFDGALAVPYWKRLLSDFFRGNKLIPEYLGAPGEVHEEPADMSAQVEDAPLAALISLEPGSIDGPTHLCAELCQEVAGQIIPYVEIGVGEVEKHIRARMDLSDIVAIGIRDDKLNLSRLGFGASDDLKTTFDVEVRALATALGQDAEDGLIHRAAIPLVWEDDGLLVTLTIAGDANKVTTVMQQLPTVVDPTKPPSEWIEPLSDLIKATTLRQRSSVIGTASIAASSQLDEQASWNSRC